jgi:endonuclease/exonuclease/phosphatase family metal-dependent hydrolase
LSLLTPRAGGIIARRSVFVALQRGLQGPRNVRQATREDTVANLTVMTWNLQNLFPAGTEFGPATQQDYDAKIAALAGVIDAAEPDVLALQEVGPEEVLADLNAACSIDFDHRLAGVPDGRGIRVSLLSPRRLSNRVDITTYPQGVSPVQSRDLVFDDPATAENEALSDSLGRGVLSATVRAGGERVTVVVAHLKSKLVTYARQPGVVGGSSFAPNDEGERLRYAGYALYRRTAEAMTCRAALDAILTTDGDQPGNGPGTGRTKPVVFCGDLNDEPLAATTQIIQGPGGSAIDFRPGSGFRTGDRGDGYRMWNLYRLLPPDRPNHTRIYRGRGELIDHIFASHRLVNPDNIPAVEIVAATPLPSMTDDPTPQTTAPSDHAAVVATFHL